MASTSGGSDQIQGVDNEGDESDASRLMIDSSYDDQEQEQEQVTITEMETNNDAEQENTEQWQTKSTKGKRKIMNSPENLDQPIKKQQKSEPKIFAYIKGKDFNLVNQIKRDPLQYSRWFARNLNITTTSSFKLIEQTQSLRVTCVSKQQQEHVLNIQDIIGQQVIVSLPKSQQQAQATGPRQQLTSSSSVDTDTDNRIKLNHGIIFNVSYNINIEDIVTQTGAYKARRLKKRDSVTKRLFDTESVVISFLEDTPQRVNIGFLSFKVNTYIPIPIRCSNCQRFNHPTKLCRSERKRCVKCGEDHTFDDCPITEREHMKCVNCQEHHSAAWTGCRIYQETKAALHVSAIQKMSYKDALVKVRSTQQDSIPIPQQPTIATASTLTQLGSSKPTPAPTPSQIAPPPTVHTYHQHYINQPTDIAVVTSSPKDHDATVLVSPSTARQIVADPTHWPEGSRLKIHFNEYSNHYKLLDTLSTILVFVLGDLHATTNKLFYKTYHDKLIDAAEKAGINVHGRFL